MKYRHGHPFFFFFLPHLQETSLGSQPIRGNVRRTWRIFPEHVERSFSDPEYSFVTVRRILRTRFAKQKFVQLRTSCVGLGWTNTSNYVHEANVLPIKNGLKTTLKRLRGFCPNALTKAAGVAANSKNWFTRSVLQSLPLI